jgi:hypothetical protein
MKKQIAIKVNSIDDETLKIRKTNNGVGVELPARDPKQPKRDRTIDLYSDYLNKIFIQTNSKDLFLSKKHSQFKLREIKSNKIRQDLLKLDKPHTKKTNKDDLGILNV